LETEIRASKNPGYVALCEVETGNKYEIKEEEPNANSETLRAHCSSALMMVREYY
jgi:hypothetical protein